MALVVGFIAWNLCRIVFLGHSTFSVPESPRQTAITILVSGVATALVGLVIALLPPRK
jgi:hypothetical protein